MIETQHNKWADLIFKFYILRLLRKHFYSVNLLGDTPEISSSTPILLLPNHNTWWDGFFIYLLNLQVFHRPLYLMMLEEQLKKYSFFSKVGAYSIKLDNPKGVLQSMKYTLDILNKNMQPAPLVCIFPQGEMFPPSKRPLLVKPGFQWILKHMEKELAIIPLGMRIEYLDQQLPEIFFQLGPSMKVEDPLDVATLEGYLSTLLDEMLDLISSGVKGKVLLYGKRSVSENWDLLKSKIMRAEK
jgi:hypothetical protein